GRDACNIVVELDGQQQLWTPRNDFQIGYGSGVTRYGLLHGETYSTGETEESASCKMAIMSLHSYKLVKYLHGQEAVILNAYISEKHCTMYLFYRDPECDTQQPRFLMHQIVNFRSPWHGGAQVHKTLGFFRRLYNFAKQVEEFSSTEERGKAELVLAATKPLFSVRSSRTSKRKTTETADESGQSAKAPKGVAGAKKVLEAQYESVHQVTRNIFHVCDTTRASNLCVKWTSKRSEVELLARLHRAQQANGGAYVIPVLETIPSPLGDLLVMPLYTPLRHLMGFGHRLHRHYLPFRLNLVEAVAFIHSQSVAHCDLKPDNIVLQWPRPPFGHLYLIDFDNAVDCKAGLSCIDFHGTRGWTAPEVADGQRWDPKAADVWAMANVLRTFSG
ncbi:Chromosomal serine/threonine-protein kinase jil-1, partial [Tulasnella sp. 403]